jgi:protein-disulfide isomerase
MKRKPEHEPSVFRMAAKVCFATFFVTAAACIGLVSCTVETDMGDGLKELEEGQKAILERIEKIEKTQNELLASWRKRFPKRPTVDYDKVYDIEVGKSPVRGAKDAKVTLVEFSDFQCPYSQRVQPLIRDLLKAYPDDLRHVYKNLPLRFHKQARPAAKACLAAGMQGKFWEMQALVFKNPRKLSDEDLKKYAKKTGLDVEQFEEDFKGKEVEKLIEKDLAEAKKASVTGTPTLFLNGKRVRSRSEEAMKKEIDRLMEEKKKS